MANYAPWRAIERGLLTSKKWRRADDPARVLWVAMLLSTDSYGCIEADPDHLKTTCLPDVPGWTETKVAKALAKLVKAELVRLYTTDDGTAWAELVDFDKHQHREFLRKRGKRQSPVPPAQAEGAGARPAYSAPTDTETEQIGTTNVVPLAEPAAPARAAADVSEDVQRCRTALGPAVSSMVDDLVRLMASENKTGKLAGTRAYRELWEPITELHAALGEQAVLAGCRAALTNAAPNANYVKKAAKNASRRRREQQAAPLSTRSSDMSAYVQPVQRGDA